MCWGCAGGLCHFFVFSLICRRHFKKEVFSGLDPGAAGVIDLFGQKRREPAFFLDPWARGSCGREKHAIVSCARKGPMDDSGGRRSL